MNRHSYNDEQEKRFKEMLLIAHEDICLSPQQDQHMRAVLARVLTREAARRRHRAQRRQILVGMRPLLAPLAAVAALLLIVFAAGWVWTQPLPADGVATLVTERGAAQILGRRTTLLGIEIDKRVRVSEGRTSPLAVGDQISTDMDSMARLSLFDGSELELKPGLDLTLVSLESQEIELDLAAGSVACEISERRERLFRLRASLFSVEVRGTSFLLSSSPESATVSVTEGSVTVLAQGREYPLHAGESMTIHAEEILAPPAPSPTPIPMANVELSPSTEMTTRDLEGRQQFLTNESPARLSGQVSGASLVEVRLGGEVLARVPADAAGGFTHAFTPRLDGTYWLSFQPVDEDGQTLGDAVEVELIYDASPPPLAILSPTEPEVTTPAVILEGETEPGVRVWVDGAEIEVNARGRFQITLTLDPGLNSITVKALDAFGNNMQIEMGITRRK